MKVLVKGLCLIYRSIVVVFFLVTTGCTTLGFNNIDGDSNNTTLDLDPNQSSEKVDVAASAINANKANNAKPKINANGLFEVKDGDVMLFGHLTPGGLIRGSVPVGSDVYVNDIKIPVTSDGYFAFGIGRDESKTKYSFRVNGSKNSGEKGKVITLDIKKREYDIQNVNGISKKIMSPSAEDYKIIKRDVAMVNKARGEFHKNSSFMEDFIWPVEGIITGVYGSQRVYNGKPGRPHFGIDIAAPKGTDVKSPAGGLVTLAVPDMFYSGGTIIVDHGYKVTSTFLHMDELLVKVGDQVKQGDVIGKVGSTGRSTGAHLDWRVNVGGVRLDASMTVPPMPKQTKKD